MHAFIFTRALLTRDLSFNQWKDLGKSMYEYLFLIFLFRCAIMVFGEALVLAFLATTVALFGVSVHSIFTSKHNSLMELRKLEDQMMEKYGWNPSMPYNAYN